VYKPGEKSIYNQTEFLLLTGLNLSAADLATFDVALFHDRVLNRQTLELMWTPFGPNDGR
jgi:hypothetical protein